jgi:hypothetical protein
MAIDPNWVRENPEEAARQLDMLKNMSSNIRLMTSFVSDGCWPELAMLSSNPELAKLGEELNKLEVKHLNQIVDLVEQREQYRIAEEAQIALREKATNKVAQLESRIEILSQQSCALQELCDALSAHIERIAGYRDRLEAKGLMPARLAGVIDEAPIYSLARRDAEKKAEALEEAANETVPAMHKMANWLRARAAEERRKAEEVVK